MHAIIRQGGGKYYISAVFGYYEDVTAADDYERYLERIHKPYWIVWDFEKKRMIKCLNMVPNTKYIIPQVLIVDCDQSNWVINEKGEGCVDFLSKEVLNSFLDDEVQPEEILEKCRAVDEGYIYNEIREIKTQKDIEDLEWVSRCFHDAWIAETEMKADGTLYVRFDGVWGCEIEVWFWGDVGYDISSRDTDEFDPYWSCSTVILQDGFVYFVDDEDMTVDQITSEYCWFKTRHMAYRVIPD